MLQGQVERKDAVVHISIPSLCLSPLVFLKSGTEVTHSLHFLYEGIVRLKMDKAEKHSVTGKSEKIHKLMENQSKR